MCRSTFAVKPPSYERDQIFEYGSRTFDEKVMPSIRTGLPRWYRDLLRADDLSLVPLIEIIPLE